MFPLADPYINQIMGFEGFSPNATWDYKQYTNGYGTRALFPGETIDPTTGRQRLATALTNAASSVDKFAPNLPEGARAALTSLTFNSGDAWQNAGLGAAVKSGDWDAAKKHFLEYVNAGGQPNEGLLNRRKAEVSWFDNGQLPANAKPTSYEGGNMNPLMQAFSALGGGGDSGTPIGNAFSGGGQWNLGDGLMGLSAGLMSVNNPYAGAAILNSVNAQRQQMMPKFTQVGQDWVTGQPQYGWVRPGDMAVFGMNGQRLNVPRSGASGGGSSTGSSGPGDEILSKIAAAKQAGMKQEDIVNTLVPPEIRGYVSGMLNGQDEPYLLTRNAALRNSTQIMAHAIDPNLNDATIQMRKAAAKSYGSIAPNSFGGQREMAQTILSQMGQLAELTPQLGNANYGGPGSGLLNKGIQNVNASADPNYQNVLAKAETLKEGISNEMSRLLNNGTVSETTRSEWRKKLDLTGSPEAIKGGLQAAAAILQDRLQAGADQYNRAFGTEKNPVEFLDAQHAKVWKDIQSGDAFGKKGAAPGGGFTEGQTAVNKQTGQRIIFRNGQWQTM